MRQAPSGAKPELNPELSPQTLSGTRLYIRDRHEMMALDLGQ